MKHLFLLFLAISLMFMSSPALADVRNFAKISAEVPEGWQAQADDGGFWVFFRDGNDALVGIGLDPKESRDIRTLAEFYMQSMIDTDDFQVDYGLTEYISSEGMIYYYGWDFSIGGQAGAAILFDSTLDYRINDADYCLIIVTDDAIDAFSNIIYSSLSFTNGPSATHRNDVVNIINIQTQSGKNFTIGKNKLLAMAIAGGGCSIINAGFYALCLAVPFMMRQRRY